jgi:hypothetical protein
MTALLTVRRGPMAAFLGEVIFIGFVGFRSLCWPQATRGTVRPEVTVYAALIPVHYALTSVAADNGMILCQQDGAELAAI